MDERDDVIREQTGNASNNGGGPTGPSDQADGASGVSEPATDTQAEETKGTE